MITIQDMSEADIRTNIESVLQPMGESRRRRLHLRDRWCIQRDDFRSVIDGRIADTYNDPEIIGQIRKWALQVFNPQKRAVKRKAVAYKKRPRRELRKASREVNRKWSALLKSVGFNAHAKMWNEDTIACNAVVVLPLARLDQDGSPTFDFQTVTGAIAEVTEDPIGTRRNPPAVLWYLDSSDPLNPKVVSVDSQWYVWWSANAEPLRIINHGLGIFPGAVSRSTMPTEDYWDPWPNQGIVQIVAEVGVIAAQMGWTRKAQCRKLLALFKGESVLEDAVAADEVNPLNDPDSGLEIKGDGARLEVLDMITQCDPFLVQIRALQHEGVDLMSGSSEDGTPGVPANPAEKHASLEEERNGQIDQVTLFEHSMNYVLAKMATKMGHPNAVDPERLRDTFEVEFAELPYVETPEQRTKTWVERSRHGVWDPVMSMMEMRGMTEVEATEEVKKIVERQAMLNDIRTKRKTPLEPGNAAQPDPANPGDPPEVDTGRFGGRAQPPANAE
jgi:hypothetical protein